MFFLGFAMLKTMFMIVGHAACLEAGLFQDDVSQLHMAYLSFTKFSNLIKPTKLFRVLNGAPTFQAHSIPTCHHAYHAHQFHNCFPMMNPRGNMSKKCFTKTCLHTQECLDPLSSPNTVRFRWCPQSGYIFSY